MRVITPEIVGPGTEIDNVKHLHGAVKLIKRSLTDDNPAIFLLNAFCLMFLGTKNNIRLEKELEESYKEGFLLFYERSNNKKEFPDLILRYNTIVEQFFNSSKLNFMTNEIFVLIHANQLNLITNNYVGKWN